MIDMPISVLNFGVNNHQGQRVATSSVDHPYGIGEYGYFTSLDSNYAEADVSQDTTAYFLGDDDLTDYQDEGAATLSAGYIRSIKEHSNLVRSSDIHSYVYPRIPTLNIDAEKIRNMLQAFKSNPVVPFSPRGSNITPSTDHLIAIKKYSDLTFIGNSHTDAFQRHWLSTYKGMFDKSISQEKYWLSAYKGMLSRSIPWERFSPAREIEIPICTYNPVAVRRQELRDKILSYADLPDDFDDDDGHAPDKRDIENALSLLPHIPDAGILSVSPMVAGDGDVGYKWYEGASLEIGFMRGEISFFGHTPEGKLLLGGESFNGEVPAKLQKLFSAIFPD